MRTCKLEIGNWIEDKGRLCRVNGFECSVTKPDVSLIESILQEHRPVDVKEFDRPLMRFDYRAVEKMKRKKAALLARSVW